MISSYKCFSFEKNRTNVVSAVVSINTDHSILQFYNLTRGKQYRLEANDTEVSSSHDSKNHNITRKDVKVHDPTSVTKMGLALKTLNHLLLAKMAGAD